MEDKSEHLSNEVGVSTKTPQHETMSPPAVSRCGTAIESTAPSGVPATDGQLVSRILDGWVDAFDEVYRRHQPAMCNLARRMCDHMEAEDVAHDVLTMFWVAPGSFDPTRGSLRSYLLTRTKGRMIDVWRSRSARTARETVAGTSAPDLMIDVEAEMMKRWIRAETTMTMSELPAAERTAIGLAFFGGYTYRQVAELLGRPEGTVKSSIRTGLRRMRSTINEAADTAP